MKNIELRKKEVEEITNNLKILLKVKTEKEIAKKIGISASQYSQMKNNGKLHYEKLIEMMKREKLSLDAFFGIKEDKSLNTFDIEKIEYYSNRNKFIMLQGLDNSKRNLFVIKKNNQFIVFDKNKSNFNEDGIYVFAQNDFLMVRQISCVLNSDDIKKACLEIKCINNEQEKTYINIEDLDKINMLGRVTNIIENKTIIEPT